MSAERLIISVLSTLALGASGYLLIYLNPKFALSGVSIIFLAVFLLLGLLAHATPETALGVTTP